MNVSPQSFSSSNRNNQSNPKSYHQGNRRPGNYQRNQPPFKKFRTSGNFDGKEGENSIDPSTLQDPWIQLVSYQVKIGNLPVSENEKDFSWSSK